MFDFIIGKVDYKKDNIITLLNELKLGFSICVINDEKYEIGKEYKIYTHLFLKEEEALLYGFETQVDRYVFSELIKISGIGPKTAQNILKKVTSQGLISLIKNKDINALKKISVIGVKADRVYYELKNKVFNIETYDYKYPKVFEVLSNLGYDTQKVFKVLNDLKDGLDDSEAIKEAIVVLKNE